MSLRRSISWIDTNGFTRQTQPRGSATLASLQSSLLAASNADVLTEYEGTENINGAPAPTAATYQNVTDTANLLFQTAGGNIVTVVLPAPQAGIFLADGTTVDPANALVTAIVAAALAVVVDITGAAVVAYLGGTRR